MKIIKQIKNSIINDNPLFININKKYKLYIYMLKNTSHNSHILTLDSDFKCTYQEHEKEKVDSICLHKKCNAETR